MKVAPGVFGFGLNVPVAAPVTIDHVPVAPPAGVFPPSDADVLPAHIVCGPPVVAVGYCFTVTVTSANESGHGGSEIVHLTMPPP